MAQDEAGTWGEGLSGEGFARLTADAGIGGVLGYRLKNLVPDFQSALAASVDVVLTSWRRHWGDPSPLVIVAAVCWFGICLTLHWWFCW